jgi:RNA 2',3'-cyclic 3'-phosphodiesterase
MRLFVALSLSAAARETFSVLLAELHRADPKTRWIHPANLHVTLKFIGNVAEEKLPCIEHILTGVPVQRQFAIEFRGLGFFPNERHPAVIWAGIVAPPELAALATRIDEAVSTCGIARETRPFAPHLTLARFKEPRLAEALRAQSAQSKDRFFAKQSVGEFQLLESRLKSGGAEYTTLRAFPFLA